MSEQIPQCVSCGSPMAGPYCAACGEPRLEPGDLTLRHFLAHALESFIHVDGKIFRTVRTLLVQPGRLTADFCAGRRKPYVGPLQLFLATNLVFFLGHSFLHVAAFTTPLRFHSNSPYAWLVRPMIDHRIAALGIAPVDYADRFDQAADTAAHSLVLALVPIFALGVAACYSRRGRPFLQHLVFALHFCTFLMLALMLLGGMRYALGGVRETWWDLTAILAACSAYLGVAARVTYGESLGAVLTRTVGLVVLLYPSLVLYRLLLFFVVYWRA
jgi:Protein of unknown function (DUF3667)